ncbi:D-isomer specific 2-hydroxyacid dehydrogenase NAD-binding [Thermoanaerobacterium thermosaccharolyticum DSM 571]|uniref:D-isomer specific 2-hydroxyacid dehydrogenase NAD-binding n=1 Tax=Thermoanaerobacterium thermosaccharolyticum (strain ATCC 7956 / DSM 571 / NCIMB 9385 / NCA 3814 / NCTC 13789 / WDCM 00135 / 2032) TaxID=580327 RepID=D9TRN8_THETC|nr:D-2-hydroxyacid dehydrogenase [Thermoanaerobacterium thermosaccharolyticum]ADL69631.1 D-isomer specific 2-hydroxyacid dehydrogenase NAD-binding [Thermoanaerobacterium thermosaccharolyticum DSM 571]
MKNILFLSKVNSKYIEEMQKIAPQFNVICLDDKKDAYKYIKDTEVLVCFDGDADAEFIHNAENLKWIHLLSAGADAMPFDVLKERKIILTNSKGVHKYQISEQVLGYMLLFERALNYFIRKQMNREWDKSVRVSELYGKSVCILGVGSIGEEIARIAREFGMKTIGVRKSGNISQFIDEMYTNDNMIYAVSKADYVICALPLTDETYHLLGKDFFKNMKNDAVFINIGRGKVVDESSLIDALKNKTIRGAALDVFEEEPLSKESPLWDMENVIITPHTAGISPHYMERGIEIIKHNIKAYLGDGDFINRVDLEKQY